MKTFFHEKNTTIDTFVISIVEAVISVHLNLMVGTLKKWWLTIKIMVNLSV